MRDVAARNLLERANVQPLEVDDERLAVDRSKGIYRPAVILALRDDRNFNSEQLEHFRVIDLLFQLVERELPLQMQKISVEEVVVGRRTRSSHS